MFIISSKWLGLGSCVLRSDSLQIMYIPELLDDLLLPLCPLLGWLLVVDCVAVILGDEVPRLEDRLLQGQRLVGGVGVHLRYLISQFIFFEIFP